VSFHRKGPKRRTIYGPEASALPELLAGQAMEARRSHQRRLLARRLPGRFTTIIQEITNGSADELHGQQPRLDRRSPGRLRQSETFHLLL